MAVNLRDYPGSSRFTASELDPLGKSDKESQALLYKARGHELASFLIWFIRNEKIPPLITEEGKATGGLSLLSWSWGTTMTISMLAHAESLPLEFQELLDKYWRSHIAFGASVVVLIRVHSAHLSWQTHLRTPWARLPLRSKRCTPHSQIAQYRWKT